MFVPARFGGLNLRPRGRVTPTVVANAQLSTHAWGEISVRVLRWEMSDFDIEELDKEDGHFHTFVASFRGKEYDLVQSEYVFWTNEAPAGLKYRDPPMKPRDHTGPWPKWHKCDRCWPALDGVLYEFVGQFYYDAGDYNVGYLFVHPTADGPLLAIYGDKPSRQDAEEHYREEESRERGRT